MRRAREEGMCDEDEARGNVFAKETQAATRYLHLNDFAANVTGILDGEMKNVQLRNIRIYTMHPSARDILFQISVNINVNMDTVYIFQSFNQL